MSVKQTNEEFIRRSILKWNNKNDYSITEYKANNLSVNIKCNIHNIVFSQVASNHYYFEGCPECYAENQRKIFSKGIVKFIEDAQKIHGNIYDYSKVKYINQKEKVCIICSKHGEFWQIANNHLEHKCGCPKCATENHPGSYFNHYFDRYPEKKNKPGLLYFVKFIDKNTNFSFYKLGITSHNISYRFGSKKYKNNFNIEELWIYSDTLYNVYLKELELKNNFKYLNIKIPYKNFNGKNECYFDIIPKPQCNINVFVHELKNKQNIVTSRLSIKNNDHINLIKIHARKCEIKKVNKPLEKLFLNKTHIQGMINSKVCYGLYYNNKLVSLMSFGIPRYDKTYEWELLRFSSNLNTIVNGGASRLFKYFIKKNNPKSIISYSDKRWNTGNVYIKIGMKYKHTSTANYWYIKNDEVLSRIQCQKHKLPKLLGEKFDNKKTEKENMLSNGYEKIKDLGNDVFIWPHQRFQSPKIS